jgi:hypothetical protein
MGCVCVSENVQSNAGIEGMHAMTWFVHLVNIWANRQNRNTIGSVSARFNMHLLMYNTPS